MLENKSKKCELIIYLLTHHITLLIKHPLLDSEMIETFYENFKGIHN